METTLTIRIPKKQRAALKRCAASLRRSESEIVRELIDRETGQRSIPERARNLIGSLDSSQATGKSHPLKAVLRERNWRK